MSVKFKFELSDIEASNLFDILNNEESNCIAKSIETDNTDYQLWYLSRADYVKKLKNKIFDK